MYILGGWKQLMNMYFWVNNSKLKIKDIFSFWYQHEAEDKGLKDMMYTQVAGDKGVNDFFALSSGWKQRVNDFMYNQTADSKRLMILCTFKWLKTKDSYF